jgi:hypothetical protein
MKGLNKADREWCKRRDIAYKEFQEARDRYREIINEREEAWDTDPRNTK